MYLEKVSPEKLKARYKPGKIQAILEQFMAMDTVVARVHLEPGQYKSPSSASSSFNACAKRLRLPLRATVADKVLYLVKENPTKLDIAGSKCIEE
jgi:hypothetical protein